MVCPLKEFQDINNIINSTKYFITL